MNQAYVPPTQTRTASRTIERLVSPLRSTRGALIALGVAILASAALTLYATDGQTFVVDELYYYARVALRDSVLVHYPSQFSPGYLLAPFNGHLALGGRTVYEAVFATIGAHYVVLVLVNVAAISACATLLFLLIRDRLGNLAALAPCILVLFLGFAREQFLWALDFNSSAALAAGLGAVMLLRREDRRGDLLACLLLAISISLIEIGLAFAAGIALMILLGRDRWRRLWIVAVPLVLYLAWWLWATPRFGQNETDPAHVLLIPKTFLHGLGGLLGAMTGTNPVVPGLTTGELTWFGGGLAIVAAIALLVRISRGALPVTFWVWLTTLGVYWGLLAAAARPAEASRYLLVGAVLVILIAAECVRRPLGNGATLALFVLVFLALPANIDQLVNDRESDVFHHDSRTEKVDFAMVELARDHVDPEFVVSADPNVAAAGGGLFLGVPAGAYLEAAEQHGGIGYSLDELRKRPEEERQLADVALVAALGVGFEPYTGPAATGCETVAPAAGEETASVEIPNRGAVLENRGSAAVKVGLRRFSDGPGVVPATLEPDSRATIAIPTDAAPEPWQAVVTGPVDVCSAAS